jgi:hypothetical protein
MRNGTVSGKESASRREKVEQSNAFGRKPIPTPPFGRKRHGIRKRKSVQGRRRMAQIKRERRERARNGLPRIEKAQAEAKERAEVKLREKEERRNRLR